MSRKRTILMLLLFAGIATAAVWRFKSGAKPAADKDRPAGDAAISVSLAVAEIRDIPVWLSGIGTVQASAMVTVRPRVSGSLDKVNFSEGAMVKEGDILARIDPRPYEFALAEAEAKKAQDEAQLANARRESERFQNLSKDGAVSTQQLDQAQASVVQLAALVQADQAAIRAAQLDLDLTTVRAPIPGRTGVRLVDAGNIVTANQGEGLVVLAQLKPISVIFTLPQQNLPVLGTNMRTGASRLNVQALSEDGGMLDEGELELIDNQIDVATGTLKLKATFPNEKLALWPGQFVSARVLVETRKNSIVIPSEAVRPGLDGRFCYVVKSDDTVEARPVKAGLSFEGMSVIEEGLKEGERVVTDGQSKLKPGSRVIARDKTP